MMEQEQNNFIDFIVLDTLLRSYTKSIDRYLEKISKDIVKKDKLNKRVLDKDLSKFMKVEMPKIQKNIVYLAEKSISSGYQDYIDVINKGLDKSLMPISDDTRDNLLNTRKYGRSFTFSQEINSKMVKYMNDSINHIKKLIKSNSPIVDIQNAIFKQGKDSLAYKLRRITNEEVRRAYSIGQQTAYNKIPIDKRKEFRERWVTAGDERVRKTHSYLNGKFADIKGFFTTIGGSRAKKPRTFSSANENIGCRCRTILEHIEVQ